MSGTVPLPSPSPPPELSADSVGSGPLIPAIDRLKHFSPAEWEDFVLEWADSLRSRYELVEKCGGAGDMGRDVIATPSMSEPDIWDNYQCKHYNHPLRPSDIWLELGKVVYYSHQGAYTFPRAYMFVAPQGSGTSLIKLFKKPDELKSMLIDKWDQHCRSGITNTEEVLLNNGLRSYLDGIDFNVIGYIPAQRLIDQHRKTRWHIARFGGGLPSRPPLPIPPTEPDVTEVVYLGKLLSAYAEYRGHPVNSVQDLAEIDELLRHYDRSRRDFYSAESLRGFSRDTLPPGSYEQLQDEVLAGIEDILHGQHNNGYQRVLAVVRTARQLQLTRHALVSRLDTRDRAGICHQLANDREEVKWVSE